MKNKIFKRAVIEMNKKEYKTYKIGSYYGRIEGFAFGTILTRIIAVLISVL